MTDDSDMQVVSLQTPEADKHPAEAGLPQQQQLAAPPPVTGTTITGGMDSTTTASTPPPCSLKSSPPLQTSPFVMDVMNVGSVVKQLAKLEIFLAEDKVDQRDTVDAVLNIVSCSSRDTELVGGKFDLESNFVVTQPETIKHVVQFVETLPEKTQAEVWSMLSGILRKSKRNMLAFSEVNFTEFILDKMNAATPMMADLLTEMLTVLAGYSITVKELQILFAKLRAQDNEWPAYAPRLLKVLQQMPARHGPDEFFSFPGSKHAAVALPPMSPQKWPWQNGWTFSTWLKLDPFTGVSVDQEKPFVFCFHTKDGLGYSAHFTGSVLVLTSNKQPGRGYQACIQYEFEPRKWYHISLAYIYNRWKTSIIKCYVNGQLVSTVDMAWFVEPGSGVNFDKCYIGASPDLSAQNAFCGQMSTVYAFNEALASPVVEALYHLGPEYKSQFRFENECKPHVTDLDRRTIYDGRLTAAIVLMYSPVACDSHICLDTSPTGNQTLFVHAPHAMMTGGVKAVITHSIHSTLHSLGGIQTLFPLFGQLDCDLIDANDEDTICSTLMDLLCDLLISSDTLQQQVVQNRGFLIISHLLEEASPSHLTTHTVSCIIRLLAYFCRIPSAGLLVKHIADHLLFNPALWIHADVKVQAKLYDYIASDFLVVAPFVHNKIRRVSTVIQLMHTIKHFYWVKNPQELSGIQPRGTVRGRPSAEELSQLRAILMVFVDRVIKTPLEYGQEPAILDDEVQCLLNFVSTVNEPENLYDIMHQIASFMVNIPATMVPLFDAKNGVRAMFKLLTSESEAIRIQALKILGHFLARSTVKRKEECMERFNLFSLIAPNLLSTSKYLSMNIYNVLFELLTEQIGKKIITGPHPHFNGEDTHIRNSEVLKVIAKMIKQSEVCEEVIEVKKIFLDDLVALCEKNEENRRAILQMSVWQDWLFSLAYVYPQHQMQADISNVVMELFRILLYHAIKIEYGGWRVWIDTLSILHTRVSYEDFAVHMSRMHEDYQAQQANAQALELRQQVNGNKDEPDKPAKVKMIRKFPAFRIPEFRWSHLHQRLVSDVLYSIELQMNQWKGIDQSAIVENVNAIENQVFVVNCVNIVSHLSDVLITAVGGLLPLLSAATTTSGTIDVLEPGYGISIEKSVSLLQRLLNLADIVIIASNIQLSDLEDEKNLTRGTMLRQCLRIVSTMAVRNCLECRHRTGSVEPPTPLSARNGGERSADPVQALINGAKIGLDVSKDGTSASDQITNLEHLLQEPDVARLRAILYRDVDDTKQSQWIAMATIYFVSVLMVSKYRDILEPASTPISSPQSQEPLLPKMPQSPPIEAAGSNTIEHSPSPSKRSERSCSPHRPSDSEDDDEERKVEQVVVDIHEETQGDEDCSVSQEKTTPTPEESTGEQKENPPVEAVQDDTPVEAKTSEKTEESPTNGSGDAQSSKGDGEEEKDDDTNQKSDENQEENETQNEELVATQSQEEMKEPEAGRPDEVPSEATPTSEEVKEPQAGGSADEPQAGSSADEPQAGSSADEPQAGSSADEPSRATEEEKPTEEGQVQLSSSSESTSDVTTSAETSPSHKGEDTPDKTISAIDVPQASAQSESVQLPKESIPKPLKLKTDLRIRDNLSERLETALGTCAPLLREIFLDFTPYLAKTLIGSKGQELLTGGLTAIKMGTSAVELVMLLCSQEWQVSLQKHAGLSFIELVNEGRLVSHSTRDHITKVANEAEHILNKLRADDAHKHEQFQIMAATAMLETLEEELTCDRLITSAKRRDTSIAAKTVDKVLNIISSARGPWAELTSTDIEAHKFWKLDVWEDDSRRRRRMIPNPKGTTHPEAALRAAIEHGENEDAINQARDEFHDHLNKLRRQKSEAELSLDDMDDLDLPNVEYAGPVALSAPCSLISYGIAVAGTLSVTKFEVFYEWDEENPSNKKIDPKVLSYVDVHGRWHFHEMRAIFSRRYLLQRRGLEIFLVNRTSVMFAFPDQDTVKKVVNLLPKLGIGVKYGVRPSRSLSLAPPKLLLKESNMTQKWQRREISNFDYLMFLNTVAGRSYNDLNQYPVFPWVISNYTSDKIDLSDSSNYRDLTKPIGCLDPERRKFFAERYASWENDHIPPFHYGTHYSTNAFTLNWLVRVEPYSSLFLNLQGGKFDHANRTFASMEKAWNNCQSDTSDVKELIPELFSLPELLINSNRFKFGTDETGKAVNDVELPPWAASPEEFIRINREALESEIVSCQLHEWIDLIFGYKQQGTEAVSATNVFYYLTYEGSIDLNKMHDPVMREAVEHQIKCFGQTPSQLLTTPHPMRGSQMTVTPKMFTPVDGEVCMTLKFWSNSPVVHLSMNGYPQQTDNSVITIQQNRNFARNRWNNKPGPKPEPPKAALVEGQVIDEKALADQLKASLPLALDPILELPAGQQVIRRSLGDNFDEIGKLHRENFCTSIDNRYIFACGYWDNSYRVYNADSGRLMQVIYGHFDIVSCIARSEVNMYHDCFLVTGSRDCTCMLWHWNGNKQKVFSEMASSTHNPIPLATLTGHTTPLTSVVISAELGVVVSSSKDGPCLLHTMNGDLLKTLSPPDHCTSPHSLLINREGYIAALYNHTDMCLFSINGRFLLNRSANSNVESLVMTRDGKYMVTAGEAGVVSIWRSHDLSHLHSFTPREAPVYDLVLSYDHRYILAAVGVGSVVVFNVDFTKWHHDYQRTPREKTRITPAKLTELPQQLTNDSATKNESSNQERVSAEAGGVHMADSVQKVEQADSDKTSEAEGSGGKGQAQVAERVESSPEKQHADKSESECVQAVEPVKEVNTSDTTESVGEAKSDETESTKEPAEG